MNEYLPKEHQKAMLRVALAGDDSVVRGALIDYIAELTEAEVSMLNASADRDPELMEDLLAAVVEAAAFLAMASVAADEEYAAAERALLQDMPGFKPFVTYLWEFFLSRWTDLVLPGYGPENETYHARMLALTAQLFPQSDAA